MLCRLHVINYALIDDVEIEFGSGLNIITGETGAGKSILIGALGMALGMRASSEVIRTGEDRCVVEGIFELRADHPCRALLVDAGIEVAQGELILRREVLAEGRSRCYANGLAIPVRLLNALGRLLVDLHGQHDHQSLLDADRHIDFLDGFGNLGELREAVETAYHRLVALQEKLAGRQEEARRMQERRELLAFQVEEIDTAAPESEEDARLTRERSVLEHAERLIEIAVQLEMLLYQGEASIADHLGTAVRLVDEAARMDHSLKPPSEELNALRYQAEELARFFTDYAQRVEHNPERLEEITDRLELLGRLKKKYGESLEAVLAYRGHAAQDLAHSDAVDVSLNKIAAEIAEVEAEFSELCGRLSQARAKAARQLSSGIRKALGELGMPRVAFRVNLTQMEDPEGMVVRKGKRFAAGARGIDRGEFYISTNPGEEVRPLARVASGGEISRIMLALKTVLAHTDSVQVLIFDEIDIGISGRIAEVVGKRLKALSHAYQTISITHLPQIAKMADQHFSVRKGAVGKRTVTRVLTLHGEARIEELARLLGGEKISKLTMQHAREILGQN